MATRKPSSRALAAPLSMHSRAWVRVNAMSGHLHEDLVALEARSVRRNTGAAPGKGALSGPDVVDPAVPGAGEAGPVELALAQRAPLVSARVAAGVDLIADPDQDDPCAVDLDRSEEHTSELQSHHD